MCMLGLRICLLGMTQSVLCQEAVELTPPHSVIVAVLEMSLLGDGFRTQGPLHSSTSSASRPVFKRCRREPRDPRRVIFLWQASQEAPPHP